MDNRDLLLEFIQWCVGNPGLSEDLFEDPLAAVIAVDEFLDAVTLAEAPVTGEGDEK